MAKKRKALAKLTTEELVRGATKGKTLDELLEEAKDDFLERGSKLVILEAMYYCLEDNVPFPLWLTDAFKKAILDVKHLKLSWNEVFGNPIPKADKRGRQLRAFRLRARLALPVYLKVREYQAQNKAVDFRKIAADITGATEATVKRVYYDTKKDHETWEALLRRIQIDLRELEPKLRQISRPKLAALIAECAPNKVAAEWLTLIFSQKIEDF